MKVFYNEKQSAKDNDSFSPSASKPALAVASWQKLGVPIEIESFRPLTAAEISKAHDPQYVEGVLNCTILNGFANTNPAVAESLPWICGSAVASALYTFKTGKPSFAPCSGAHHAHWSYGSAFCTFNHIILSAIFAKQAGAKKIGICDLDAHFADSTVALIKQFGLDYIHHYTFGAHCIRAGESAERWLSELPGIVEQFHDCDLVIFNAGVDAHVNDVLGGILTTEQLRLRDRIVYQTLSRLGIAASTQLAGGYWRDREGTIAPVLRLHDQTMLECVQAYEGHHGK